MTLFLFGTSADGRFLVLGVPYLVLLLKQIPMTWFVGRSGNRFPVFVVLVETNANDLVFG